MEHSHHGHEHHHAPSPAVTRASDQRRLLIVISAALIILVGEVIAGFVGNSLALLSDAAHMSTDVAALALSYVAIRIAARPPTSEKSYGYYRAETVAAFVNALALWLVTAYFVYEAYQRLRAPEPVDGLIVAIVGGITLVVNLGMAAVIHGGQGHSMNMRSAYIHVLSDALGSLAALVAGLGILFYGALWLDPAITVLITVLIVIWTWRLTRDSLHILLEGTPARVTFADVKADIEGVPGVQAVHDLHVWSLTTGIDNLSAHIMVEDAAQGPSIVAAIREKLVHEHKLSHVTIEVETKDSPNCVRCD